MASQGDPSTPMIPEGDDEGTANRDYTFAAEEQKPIKVFINRVDTRFGVSILKYFGKTHSVASCDGQADAPRVASDSPCSPGDNEHGIEKSSPCPYKFYGTISEDSDTSGESPPPTASAAIDVQPTVTIINKYDRAAMEAIWSDASWLIFDIMHTEDAIEEAVDAFDYLHRNAGEPSPDGKQRVFALLSTFMTWVRTPPADPDDKSVSMDSDYLLR